MTQPTALSPYGQKQYDYCMRQSSKRIFHELPGVLQATDMFLGMLGMPTVSKLISQFTSMRSCYRFAETADLILRIKQRKPGLENVRIFPCKPWEPAGEPGSCEIVTPTSRKPRRFQPKVDPGGWGF